VSQQDTLKARNLLVEEKGESSMTECANSSKEIPKDYRGRAGHLGTEGPLVSSRKNIPPLPRAKSPRHEKTGHSLFAKNLVNSASGGFGWVCQQRSILN
jgi:hypothetical protein